MPEQVAVALRPPKSVAAVPAINDVTPIAAMTMKIADQPTITGEENKNTDIATVSRKIKPQSSAAGGPRRDWKNLSDMNPPANPPTIPKTQTNKPQWSTKNSVPGCFTSRVKATYQFMIPLRKTPEVNSTHATSSSNG